MHKLENLYFVNNKWQCGCGSDTAVKPSASLGKGLFCLDTGIEIGKVAEKV